MYLKNLECTKLYTGKTAMFDVQYLMLFLGVSLFALVLFLLIFLGIACGILCSSGKVKDAMITSCKAMMIVLCFIAIVLYIAHLFTKNMPPMPTPLVPRKTY
jgi:hypothetical protein